MNFRFVTYLVSLAMLAIGAGLLVSAGVGALYGGDDVVPLVISGAVNLVIGVPLFAVSQSARRAYIGFREGFVAVVSAWVAATLFGAFPYVLAGVFGPLDAIF